MLSITVCLKQVLSVVVVITLSVDFFNILFDESYLSHLPYAAASTFASKK